MNEPRPCAPGEAVERAMRIANVGGQYVLGTGDYRPTVINGKLIDVPWSSNGDNTGSDCAGFALSWCYKLRRHRPGFNRGGTAFGDVEDDINCNSALGDTFGARDCFELATGTPQPGDLLVYPTFRLPTVPNPFIGHVGIVVSAGRVGSWDSQSPRYDLLDVAQCRGPNGRSPGVILTDGSIWMHHAEQWPRPEHTVYVLRALP